MRSTRWMSPQGVRLCLLRKGQVYEVSRYCGHYLIAHGYAERI
ncbi:MAG: hypothetical protein P8P30_03870 [Rickettsiales bacterium]|nr:hypothetical protein [Rickettsiales bacterium]